MTEEEIFKSYGVVGNDVDDIKTIYLILDDDGKYESVYFTYNDGEIETFKKLKEETIANYTDSVDRLLEFVGVTDQNRRDCLIKTRKLNEIRELISRFDKDFYEQKKVKSKLGELSKSKIGTQEKDINAIYMCLDKKSKIQYFYVQFNDDTIEKVNFDEYGVPDSFFSGEVMKFLESVGSTDANGYAGCFTSIEGEKDGVNFNVLETEYNKQRRVKKQFEKNSHTRIGDTLNSIKKVYIQKDDDGYCVNVYVEYINGKVDKISYDENLVPYKMFYGYILEFLDKVGATTENLNKTWVISNRKDDFEYKYRELDEKYYYEKSIEKENIKKLNKYTVKEILDTRGSSIATMVAGKVIEGASFLTCAYSLIHKSGGLATFAGVICLISMLATKIYGKYLKKDFEEIREIQAYKLGLDEEEVKKGRR